MTDIRDYIQYRAKEGRKEQGFRLTVEWFEYAISQGIRVFFGCSVDSQGNVLSDTTNPSCLQAYWFKKFLAHREPLPVK